MMTAKRAEFLDLVRTGLTVYYLELVVSDQAEEDAAMWVMDRLAAAYAAAHRIPVGMTALKAAEDFVEAIRRPEKTADWLEEETVETRIRQRVPPLMTPP